MTMARRPRAVSSSKGDYPANTGITVNRLLRPEGHVEVEAVAVLGGPSTSSGREEIQVPGWEASYERRYIRIRE